MPGGEGDNSRLRALHARDLAGGFRIGVEALRAFGVFRVFRVVRVFRVFRFVRVFWG